VWGAVLASYCRANQSPFMIVAWGLLIYGVGLIFAGPTVVDVREAHWHVLAYICILVPVAAFYLYGQKLSERWVEREQRI
jgi:hypothetical protein